MPKRISPGVRTCLASALARTGQSLFETQHIHLSNFDGPFSQVANISAYTGLLTNLTITGSLAQEPGLASNPDSGQDYQYSAFAYALFYDGAGQYLGGNVLAYNAGPSWLDFSDSFGFLPYLNQITTVEIGMQGVWALLPNGAGGEAISADWITDSPAWSRYDNFGLTVTTVPEPAGALAAAGIALVLLRRRPAR